MCKILEAIIEDNIVDHSRKFQFIERSQHGFTRNRSCLNNLLEYLEFVSSYIDRGIPVDVVYLGIQKAFGKVPHRRLLAKVNSMGINGLVSRWIENWLKDRDLAEGGIEWWRVKMG